MGYGQVTQEAVKQDSEKGQSSKWFKPQDNKPTLMFVCPPWTENYNLPYLEVKVHYGLRQWAVPCAKMWGKHCPICAENDILYARKDDPAAQELSKDIYAKSQFIFNFLPDLKPMQTPTGNLLTYGGDSKEGATVKPYMASPTLKNTIMGIYNFQGNIFDPMNAMPLMLQKTTLGKSNAQINIQAYPVRFRLDDSLLALMQSLPDLTKMLEPENETEVAKLLDMKMASYRASRTNFNGTMAPVMTMPVPVQSVATPVVASVTAAPVATPMPVPTMAPLPPMPSMGMPPGPVTIGSETPATPAPVANPVPTQPTPAPKPLVGVQSLDELEKQLRGNK